MLFLRKLSLTILLVAQATFCFAENTIDLTQSVLQQKQSLPQSLSDNLLLTDIDYNQQKQILSYKVTAIGIKAEEIDTSKIVDSVCYKPTLYNAIKDGLAVSFLFYTPDKTLLNNITINESSCLTYIKKQNELIQQDITKLNSSLLPEKIDDNLTITTLKYQPSNQTIIANIIESKKITSSTIDQTKLLAFTCSHYYFKHMLNKNISIAYSPANPSSSLSKNIIITSKTCENKTLDPLDNQLLDEAKKMKSNLKSLSTNQIEIVDIGYDPKKKQVWNKAVIKIPNITKDKLNPNLNIRAICATPSIRNIISQGISYLYSYYDMNDRLIMQFNVNENRCKQVDRENNILLNKHQ